MYKQFQKYFLLSAALNLNHLNVRNFHIHSVNISFYHLCHPIFKICSITIKVLEKKKTLQRFNISLLYTFYSSHHNQFLCLSMISYFAVTHFFEAVFLLGGSTPNSLVVIVSNIIYISSSTEFSHFCPFQYSNNDQPCE